MKKHITALCLIVNLVLFAQDSEIPSATLTSYAPASPTVSALMNFAEIPVNEFTGVPAINENIFSTSTLSKNVNFNMSYAYHPKGISLNEKSSDFGTGWSLNCGGAISRMVFLGLKFQIQITQILHMQIRIFLISWDLLDHFKLNMIRTM